MFTNFSYACSNTHYLLNCKTLGNSMDTIIIRYVIPTYAEIVSKYLWLHKIKAVHKYPSLKAIALAIQPTIDHCLIM